MRRYISSEDDSLWSDDDQDTGAAAEAPEAAKAAKAVEAPKETPHFIAVLVGNGDDKIRASKSCIRIV